MRLYCLTERAKLPWIEDGTGTTHENNALRNKGKNAAVLEKVRSSNDVNFNDLFSSELLWGGKLILKVAYKV